MKCFKAIAPLLHLIQAESAHNLAIKAINHGFYPDCKNPVESSKLHSNHFGLEFSNPIGLAAGFDKNAEAYHKLFAQNFAFVEVGTITPKPQIGNPKPRLFRLKEDAAVINRMGFNNAGVATAKRNLRNNNISLSENNIIGINIGKNKDTEKAINDYSLMLREIYQYASYVTINISSPNTPNLRDLQHKSAVLELMTELYKLRDELSKTHSKKPLLVKIAPDLDEAAREDIAEVALSIGFDGLIVGNTTISRPDSLQSNYKTQAGGLSGKPLMDLSTEVLADIYRLTKGKIPLIGVGGIASANDAITKIKSGASLVQLYSAFVYQGFDLVNQINAGILDYLDENGLDNISDLIGIDVNLG